MAPVEAPPPASAAVWQERLEMIVQMMREMSGYNDPQAMVDAYGKRMAQIMPVDKRISLSRRGLEFPQYRITRYSLWSENINPWKQKHRLPILEGGLLGELIYSNEPRIIDDLQWDEDDPGAEYLDGQRSLMAIPMLDQEVALNMVVLTRAEPAAFDYQQFPDIVWTSNLFGRATHNLVLADQVREAYEVVDRELKVVADIQRSLLPGKLPEIPGVQLATHYQTSQRAGGDYYDFFPLDDGKWGIWIADVSGHGTPAAVMMAVTHSIAHMFPRADSPPSKMLEFVNQHLTRRYTSPTGTFVTAFYGIYDPATRQLTYSSAGHNPPRIKHCGAGALSTLDGARDYPLGISRDVAYEDETQLLQPGDQIVFYTDGITEAVNPDGEIFGVGRLDKILAQCREGAKEIIDAILLGVESYAEGQPVLDDRTLIVAKVF